MENLETGLLLMVVGMATVFVILLIVIYLGKGLIALVNKYAPEEIIVKKHVSSLQAQTNLQMQTNVSESTSGSTTAAIISAVSMVTGGKGNVTKIEKL